MAKFDNLHRPLPDSYELPPLPPEAPAPPTRAWDATLLAFLCLGGVFSGLLLLVPKFDEVYSQMKLSIRTTDFLLGCSRIVGAWPIPFLALTLGYAWWAGRPRLTPAGRRMRGLINIACVLFAVWCLWAIFTPLLAPMGSMGPLRR